MKRCLRICIGLFLGSVAALVFEVFMLFALEFCDGEDLMPLFWSTWAMTQVGSSIAIVGIILAVWHSMRGRNHP